MAADAESFEPLLKLAALRPLVDGRRGFGHCLLARAYTVAFFCSHAYMLWVSVSVLEVFRAHVGMLHAFTVSSAIAGMKPLVNGANLLVFAAVARRHRALLDQLQRARVRLDRPPPALPHRRSAYFAVAVSGVVLLSVRVVESVLCGEPFGQRVIHDLSFVLVPLLTVWAIVPLVYFASVYSSVVSYNDALRRRISAVELDDKAAESTPDYRRFYQDFDEIVNVQECCSSVFGPWVLLSIGWSVFTLCLTLYYCTQTSALVELPPQVVQDDDAAAVRLVLYFNVVYSAVQVVVSAAYLVVICVVGIRVNESTRQVLKTVLQRPPEARDEMFQVSKFVFRLQSQDVWGVSAWKTFSIERGSCFTIMSLVLTYTVLLLRLRNVAG